jgi:hypothetical protein
MFSTHYRLIFRLKKLKRIYFKSFILKFLYLWMEVA